MCAFSIPTWLELESELEFLHLFLGDSISKGHVGASFILQLMYVCGWQKGVLKGLLLAAIQQPFISQITYFSSHLVVIRKYLDGVLLRMLLAVIRGSYKEVVSTIYYFEIVKHRAFHLKCLVVTWQSAKKAKEGSKGTIEWAKKKTKKGGKQQR
ncbi:hypothetical protein Tco_0873210 [Tanacetum coccineum]